MTHPFEGGRLTASVTRKHRRLIWENLLGTVNACDPLTGEEKYFDYDWNGARAFARVTQCTDLRLCSPAFGPTRITPGGAYRRQHAKPALYGIPPAPADGIRKITGAEFLKVQADGAHTVHTATLQAVTDPKHGWHRYVVEVIETGRYYAVIPKGGN